MKLFFMLISVLFQVIYLQAQDKKERTIYVNQKNNVHLFFDSPIKSGIVGNDDYIFVYNTEQKEKIGILKAVKSEPTNLLVITDDGNIFSFILEYRDLVSDFNYFIQPDEAIGNVDAEKVNPVKKEHSDFSNDSSNMSPIYENNYDSIDFHERGGRSDKIFKENCVEAIGEGKFYKRFYAVNQGIRLSLFNLIYKDNYYYFYLEISNETKVDYDLNFMDFYIATQKVKARSSSQKIIFKPDYVFNALKRVNGNSKEEFVYVMKKFTVSENKVLLIEMNELKGERNLTLKIPQEIINNPN